MTPFITKCFNATSLLLYSNSSHLVHILALPKGSVEQDKLFWSFFISTENIETLANETSKSCAPVRVAMQATIIF